MQEVSARILLICWSIRNLCTLVRRTTKFQSDSHYTDLRLCALFFCEINVIGDLNTGDR